MDYSHNERKQTGGVLQGLVLFVVLFALTMHDLESGMSSIMLKFVGDNELLKS